jgi:tripartite-type tricarboxylate transporter receptor subunit TctC
MNDNANWRVLRLGLFLPLLLIFLPAPAASQTYPAMPIRLIVANPPGGGVDTLARIMAQKLVERLGQQIVVDNRPGAGGTIGVGLLAKSLANGYVLGMGNTATLAIAPALYPKLPYDPVRDLTPIALLGIQPLVIIVHPSLPVSTVKELIALAKARPSEVNYSSGGVGTPPHLAAEVFQRAIGVNLVHVAYKGGTPAVTAVVSGEVGVMFGNMVPALPHMRARRLRALAVTSQQRWPTLPDLPTVIESGVPDYHVVQWDGVIGPSGLASAVVDRLSGEIAEVLRLDEVKDLFASQGVQVLGGGPKAFAAFIRDEMTKWGGAVRLSRARVE